MSNDSNNNSAYKLNAPNCKSYSEPPSTYTSSAPQLPNMLATYISLAFLIHYPPQQGGNPSQAPLRVILHRRSPPRKKKRIEAKNSRGILKIHNRAFNEISPSRDGPIAIRLKYRRARDDPSSPRRGCTGAQSPAPLLGGTTTTTNKWPISPSSAIQTSVRLSLSLPLSSRVSSVTYDGGGGIFPLTRAVPRSPEAMRV